MWCRAWTYTNKSANRNFKSDMQIVDKTSIAVQQENIRTIARRNGPHVENVNRFLKVVRSLYYYFIKPLRWCCNYDLE